MDECREQPLHEAGKLALRAIQRDDAVDGAGCQRALQKSVRIALSGLRLKAMMTL